MPALLFLLRFALLWSCLAAGAAPAAAPVAWQIAGGRVFQHVASAALGSGISTGVKPPKGATRDSPGSDESTRIR